MTSEAVELDVMEGWGAQRPDSTLTFAGYFTIYRTIKLKSLKLILVSEGQCFLTTDTALFGRSSDVVPYDAWHRTTTHRQTYATIAVDVQEILPTVSTGEGALNVDQRPTLVPCPDNKSSRFYCWVDMPIPRDLPDTWSYQDEIIHANVTNTVIASLKYCTVDGGMEQSEKQVRKIQKLNLKKRVPKDSFSENGAITNSEEHRLNGWWWFRPRGLIQCALTVRDQIGLLGHNFPMIVVIDNKSSATIRNISLTLYKEYMFKIQPSQRETGIVRQETISSISLSSLGPRSLLNTQIDHFAIPGDCLTSCSLEHCDFVDVRFFVRLDIRWKSGSMKCDVDVSLGNV